MNKIIYAVLVIVILGSVSYVSYSSLHQPMTTTNTVSATNTSSPQVSHVETLSITSISPSSGSVGDTVTIHGTNFASTENTVNFDSIIFDGVSSSDGTSLLLVVPSEYPQNCTKSGACTQTIRYVGEGKYAVSVSNASGTSNSTYFTVTTGAQ